MNLHRPLSTEAQAHLDKINTRAAPVSYEKNGFSFSIEQRRGCETWDIWPTGPLPKTAFALAFASAQSAENWLDAETKKMAAA